MVLTFSVEDGREQAPAGGIVRITAARDGLPPLDVQVPVAENMDLSAIAGSAVVRAPPEWRTAQPPAIAASGDSLFPRRVTDGDGDAGNTQVRMHWTGTSAE